MSGKYNEIASDSLINKCVVTQSNQVKVKPLTTIQAVLDDINDHRVLTLVTLEMVMPWVGLLTTITTSIRSLEMQEQLMSSLTILH